MKTLNDLKNDLKSKASGIEELSSKAQELIKGGEQYYPTREECVENCGGAYVNPPGGGGPWSGGWNEMFDCVLEPQGWECQHFS